MNILLIDDEKLIRKSLTQLLKKLGYDRIEAASDGIEAFEIIKNNQPDIVIADIRMPGMDGLALLSKVKEEIGTIPFIFLSGYNSFQYAQQAVQLGAFDYLLKPVKEAELKNILLKIEIKLNEERTLTEKTTNIGIHLRQGIQHMQKSFLRDLVDKKTWNERDRKQKLQQFEINLPEKHFVVLYLSIDQYTELLHTSQRSAELCKFSVENIAMEILTSHQLVAYGCDHEDGLGLYVNFSATHPIAQSSHLYEICQQVVKGIESHSKYTVKIGVGNIVDSLDQLSHSYETAHKAVMQKFVKGGNRVFFFDESPLNRVKRISSKSEQELLACFEQGRLEEAQRIVREYYVPFRNFIGINASDILKLNFQFIMIYFKILTQFDIQPEEELDTEFRLYDEVSACDSLEAVITWHERLLETCFQLTDAKKGNQNQQMIGRAIEYIHTHYASSHLSLESLAEYLHLSPAYLSKLFKQQAGENFSNYVTNIRIQMARSLLKERVYKVHEVGTMVGIHNTKYFYRIFKKYTGFSPAEYRNM